MENPFSLTPLLLLLITSLASIIAGIIIWNNNYGTIRYNLLISGIPIFLLILIFQLMNIHWNGEEGDYLLIWLVFIFYGINSFQPLRISHPIWSKVIFAVVISPMVVVISFLFMIVFFCLRWIIPALIGY